MMSDKSDPDPTIADYLAAVSAAPKAEWADESLFLAANVHWNSKQHVDAAIALWQRLLKEHKTTPLILWIVEKMLVVEDQILFH